MSIRRKYIFEVLYENSTSKQAAVCLDLNRLTCFVRNRLLITDCIDNRLYFQLYSSSKTIFKFDNQFVQNLQKWYILVSKYLISFFLNPNYYKQLPVSISLRAGLVNVRFVRVLGHGKHIFKDSVRLIAHFYSRSEYDKPFYFNLTERAFRDPQLTFLFTSNTHFQDHQTHFYGTCIF